MNFLSRLSASLIGVAIVVVQPQLAVALPSQEVNAIAKDITVKISGESNGSGVIFERDGNTYYVLTNWHVAEEDGRYEIQTPDGEIYPVYYSQQISGLDLIVLQFNSSKTYPTATLGDSDQMAETTTVYVAGWADALPGTNERAYQFTSGQITSRLQNPDNGYALIYDNPTIPGTSGGPMLDENGQLVGINGRATLDSLTGRVFSLGIPINTFLAARNNREQPEESSPTVTQEQLDNSINQESLVATSPAPTPTPVANTTSEKTQPSTSAPSQTPTLISRETGVDYTSLRDLLEAERWREADEKTWDLIIKAGDKNQDKSVSSSEIESFYCSDLGTIDNLWLQYSSGRFGFSVQKQIYEKQKQSYERTSSDLWRDSTDADIKPLRRLALQVGWKKGTDQDYKGYSDYDNLTFSLWSAPVGHLPALPAYAWQRYFKISYAPYGHDKPRGEWERPREWDDGLESFFSRLASCQAE